MFIKKVLFPFSLVLLLIFIGACSQADHSKSEQESFAELKTYIKQVDDVQRRKEMLTLVSSMENNISLFNHELNAFTETSSKLFLDYDTDREVLDKEHKEWVQTRLEVQENLIDITFDFKEISTKEEWTQIVKLQDKIYENNSKSTKDN